MDLPFPALPTTTTDKPQKPVHRSVVCKSASRTIVHPKKCGAK
jgi:hypothetical protein